FTSGHISVADLLSAIGRPRIAPQPVFGWDVHFLVELDRLHILDMAIHYADRGADGMELSDSLIWVTGAVVPIAGIGFQRLPEDDRILLEIGGLVGIGSNFPIATHRAVHQITG